MNLKRSYNGAPAIEIRQFLEEKYLQYNNPDFIACDPVSIPHRYKDPMDIEVSGFLASTIAWGRRDLILRSSSALLERMGSSPFEFIMKASETDLEGFSGFVHRTFNGSDCIAFLRGLKNIYQQYNSMEETVIEGMNDDGSLKDGLSYLRNKFFNTDHQVRAEKHFADMNGGGAGKRLNMFMRWMVRRDNRGVDFGLWQRIDPALLYIPLDLHSGNTARSLGLLKRKINDWKAVEELTGVLREFDPADPAKYDFALFGFGVNKNNDIFNVK